MPESWIRIQSANPDEKMKCRLKHIDNMPEVVIRHEAVVRSSTRHKEADQLVYIVMLAPMNSALFAVTTTLK